MGYNLDKLKEIAQPRSKEAIDKANKRYLRRHNKMEKDIQANCSAELMDNISFVPNSVNKEELVNTAKNILVEECNLTEEQADAMANMSLILEKSKYGNKN